MKETNMRFKWLNPLALVLSFPAAYVILISLLKYGFGIDGPFDSSAPFLERLGIKESLGWNINLLIVLGPLAGLILSAIQVVGLDWQFTREHFQFRIFIRKNWFPIGIAIFSGLLLLALFIYLVGENCHCG